MIINKFVGLLLRTWRVILYVLCLVFFFLGIVGIIKPLDGLVIGDTMLILILIPKISDEVVKNLFRKDNKDDD